jgi:hypothetical protein
MGSLGSLSWALVAGMSMPTAHVSEAWQSAEFYANKILMVGRCSLTLSNPR